ncbi:MAG: pyridoxal phosphate-dependent aminotransferase [Candidatus Eisenbacteria sp.]|nr:pyridoxal phosphate-dependent aminotransferase [Candidatus Eisenbacteria bacterium]
MKLAKRMARLGTETAFVVLARAKQLEREGKDMVHLEIGEPDFDTAPNIVEACIQALRDGYHHYNPSAGIPELREALAGKVGANRGITVSPEEVVVCPGGKPIIFNTIVALVDEGDEVIYPNPGYPIYESVINFVGAKAVPLVLREDRGFSFDANELKDLITPRTKMLIVNSPQNPTGSVLSREDIEAIAELAVEHDLIVLSDEVYMEILYEGEHVSIAALPGMKERTIILDAASKTYAMTGWRLGYGIMRKEWAEPVAQLLTNSVSCTTTFVQRAMLEAVNGPQDAVRHMVEEFRNRRQVIVDGLNEIEDITCAMPKGAFYAFPNITKTGFASEEMERMLLEEAGVAGLSGTAFGEHGQGYIRFSYANSVENIEKALMRIRDLLAKKKVK